jgi:hypothetical protein
MRESRAQLPAIRELLLHLHKALKLGLGAKSAEGGLKPQMFKTSAYGANGLSLWHWACGIRIEPASTWHLGEGGRKNASKYRGLRNGTVLA